MQLQTAEAYSKIQLAMIISAALIEGVVFFFNCSFSIEVIKVMKPATVLQDFFFFATVNLIDIDIFSK